jgi:hypothetical protein
VLKDLEESLTQALEFGAGETAGGAAGADTGMEQALVGIDVAHSGKEGLVEQGGLDGQLAVAEKCGEGGGGDGKGFATGGVEGRGGDKFAKFKAAEAAGIDEAEFASAREAEAGVSVGGDRILGCSDQQATGHAEVDDPLGVWLRGCGAYWWGFGAQFADDVLAGSMDPENDAAGEAFCLARAGSFERLGVRTEPHIHDPIKAQALVDSTGDGFNFGQFGHRFILKEHAGGSMLRNESGEINERVLSLRHRSH